MVCKLIAASDCAFNGVFVAFRGFIEAELGVNMLLFKKLKTAVRLFGLFVLFRPSMAL